MSEEDSHQSATQMPVTAEAFHKAYGAVLRNSAFYEETGNIVFLWNAIAAMTTPELDGLIFPLPQRVRTYLHEAAVGIKNAALGAPLQFGQQSLEALKLSSGKKGVSVPRDYSKQQSVVDLLRVYEVLKNRHGFEQAEHLMAEAAGISASGMQKRLTEARKTFQSAMAKMGMNIQAPPDWEEWSKGTNGADLPDSFFLRLLTGMPNNFWQGSSGR